MVAAKMTATEVSRSLVGDKYEMVTATVTIVTTLDWILLSELNLEGPAIYVHSYVAATGADGQAFHGTGNDSDKVFFTGTGAQRILIVASGEKSAGGSS